MTTLVKPVAWGRAGWYTRTNDLWLGSGLLAWRAAARSAWTLPTWSIN